MAAISITSFSGVSPRTPPRYLQDNQAQTALNCPAFTGSLAPLLGLSTAVHTLAKSGIPQTIYRFGQDVRSDTQYWFSWSTPVDVVRGPIAGDTSERTFFTGADDYPRATNNALALQGGLQYPLAAYRLGVPAPVVEAVAAVSGTPSSGALTESRVYAYTWVNGWGEESAPSPATNQVEVQTGEVVTLSALEAIPGGEWNLTHRRIYRSVSGTYLFVAEITAAATSYIDDVQSEDLGEELPSLTWSAPPSGLSGLTGLPGGVLAGFVGRDVYLADPYHPFAWPEGYINTVDYPVVGLGRMDTTLAVLTTGTPYFLQGTHPDSMAVVESDIEQACVSKRSIVSMNGVVLYASPDGLVMLSSGGSKLFTEQLFTRAQWQDLNPASIHAYQHDMRYVAFYDTGATTGGFVIDMTTGTFVFHTVYATAGYNDLANDTLYLAFSDRTVKKWAAGSALAMTWKSKKFSLPQATALSCAQVGADAYPVTLKVYRDGTLVHTQSVASRSPFRLPPGCGRDWEFQIEGANEVFSVEAATSMQELAGV